MIKMDDKAQGNQLLLLMLLLLMMFFIMPTLGPYMGEFVVEPLFGPVIGFDGQYPMLTLFFAGIVVVSLSSLLTNFFTDWKKMGAMQERSKSFQKEIQKARKEGNTNRVNKLMKMQPEIMKQQTDASGGMMKPMVFLIIFIWPIFMWLRGDIVGGWGFLSNLDHYYFSVPWASQVSFFYKPFLMQAWLFLYLIFSIVVGQVIRSGLKYLSWTEQWADIKKKIKLPI